MLKFFSEGQQASRRSEHDLAQELFKFSKVTNSNRRNGMTQNSILGRSILGSEDTACSHRKFILNFRSFCSQHPWKFKKFRKAPPKPIEGLQGEEQANQREENQREDQNDKEDVVEEISTIRNATHTRLTPLKLPPIKSISTQN